MKNSERAFTLIELLVVVAIIGILAALAIPAMSNAKEASSQTNTLNQIKQMSALAVLYASEHNGELPEEGGEGVQKFSKLQNHTNAWYNVLPPMANLPAASSYSANPKGFYEKSSPFFVSAAKYPSKKINNAYFAYGINSQLMDKSRPTIRVYDIPTPSRTALFAEAALPDEKDLLPTGGSTSDLGQPKVRDKRFAGRRNGAGIVGFADGHAKIVHKNKIFDPASVIWEIPKN